MLSYNSVLKQIYDLQEFSIKLGLDNIHALADYLNNPQKTYPVIHIAGTNGKGSTAYFLSRILIACGFRTGLYTSPHLMDYRERIRIDNQLIEKEYIADYWKIVKSLVLNRKATFFDTTTALAFDYFRHKNVDVAVVETGLGGRLDSTNIVEPETVVITPVNYDHEKQLGTDLKSIAKEKAGIIKPGCDVISSGQEQVVLDIIKNHLKDSNKFYYLKYHINYDILESNLNGSIFTLKDTIHGLTFPGLKTPQIGDFQVANIALAYFVARLFSKKRSKTIDQNILTRVLEKETWPGRLQVISRTPGIFIDVSHNLHGINATLSFLSKFIKKEKLHIMIGLVRDKDYKGIAKTICTYAASITVCEPDTERKLDGKIFTREIKKIQKNVQFSKDSRQAYDSIRVKLKHDESLLVIGSHYLAGTLLKIINLT